MTILRIARRCRGRWTVARFVLKLWAELDVSWREEYVWTWRTVVRVWRVQIGPVGFGYGRGRAKPLASTAVNR